MARRGGPLRRTDSAGLPETSGKGRVRGGKPSGDENPGYALAGFRGSKMAKEQKNSIHFFVEFTLFSSVVNKKLGSRGMVRWKELDTVKLESGTIRRFQG